MPDVTGLDMTEAVALLEKLGLKVETVGWGEVQSTTPPYGERIRIGEVILVRGKEDDNS